MTDSSARSHRLGEATPPGEDPLAESATTIGDQVALARAEQAIFGAAEPVAISRYVVLERIGKGAFGKVYRAFDPQLDRTIALKVVSGRSTSGSASRERLLREARAQAQVRHPNVAEIYDAAVVEAHAGTRVIIAMELVDGLDLRRWLHSERSTREILDTLVAAARGLAAAHGRGLVHCDFKPDNVLVGRDGSVKVVDFGLARVCMEANLSESNPPDGNLGRTASGGLRGTPLYMAPEALSQQRVTVASDQFSFCVTLFEALVGERPYDGRTVAELGANIAAGRMTQGIPATLPRAAARVLRRGLSLRAADRYPSMDALVADLTRRSRSRRWVLAVVGVAGLLATGVVASTDADPRSRCESNAARIHDVWNDRRQREIATAMRATGAAYADETVQRVVPVLDTWVRAWVDAHRQACTTVAAPDASEVPDRALTCLDRRVRNLEELLAVFADADRSTVERAVEAAARLPAIDGCLDPRALQEMPEPPAAPASARRVDELRAELARASALLDAGRYATALVVAQTAVEAATATGYGPLVAETYLRLAAALLASGSAREAAIALESAYFEAVRAGDRRTARDAAIQLVGLVGETLDDPTAGLGWARHAESYLAPGEESAAFSSARARAYRTAGRWDAAVADHEAALRILERQERSAEHAAALSSAGATYAKMGRYDQAVDAAQRALELERELRGARHPALVGFNLEVGRILYLMGRPEDALAPYEAAREIAEYSLDVDHPLLARVYEDLAFTYNAVGQTDEVVELMRRAVRILERRGAEVSDLAKARHGLAQVLWIIDADLEGALVQLVRARDDLERSGRGISVLMAKVSADIARLQLSALRPERAWESAEIAVRAAELAGAPELAQATVLEIAGAAALEIGALDDAEDLFLRVRDIRARAPAHKDRKVSSWRMGLARVKLLRGEVAQARADLEDLLADRKKYLPSWWRCAAQVSLAEALHQQGETAAAAVVAREAQQTAGRSRISEAIWRPRADALLAP